MIQGKDACKLEQVPLVFVYGSDQSLERFTEVRISLFYKI